MRCSIFLLFRSVVRSLQTIKYRTMSTYSTDKHINIFKNLIPVLSSNLHKGECGRIGVVGGSVEYTGAPYFSAITALKVGADLVYVFCARDAGSTIKSYSPELIVLPVLDSPDAFDQIEPWLGRLHALVVGPGLGRDPGVIKTVQLLITSCISKKIPLVVDADGLFVVGQDLSLIQDSNVPVVLTPNAVEMKRLCEVLNIDESVGPRGSLIAERLRVLVVEKGDVDKIHNGCDNQTTLDNTHSGSYRRCGGQGDLLSGATAVFVHWAHMRHEPHGSTGLSAAVYAACCVTRECSRLAFEKCGRSMTACDMIAEIHRAFQNIFTT